MTKKAIELPPFPSDKKQFNLWLMLVAQQYPMDEDDLLVYLAKQVPGHSYLDAPLQDIFLGLKSGSIHVPPV